MSSTKDELHQIQLCLTRRVFDIQEMLQRGTIYEKPHDIEFTTKMVHEIEELEKLRDKVADEFVKAFDENH
jgi:hypothetical protein